MGGSVCRAERGAWPDSCLSKMRRLCSAKVAPSGRYGETLHSPTTIAKWGQRGEWSERGRQVHKHSQVQCLHTEAEESWELGVRGGTAHGGLGPGGAWQHANIPHDGAVNRKSVQARLTILDEIHYSRMSRPGMRSKRKRSGEKKDSEEGGRRRLQVSRVEAPDEINGKQSGCKTGCMHRQERGQSSPCG